jgi:hypothetical protein
LPENPLFLVAVADVQTSEHQHDAAISSARDCLDYLDRFARPVAIAESGWPGIKLNQEAIARFVIGRALIQKALEQPVGKGRSTPLYEAATSLSIALNPTYTEASYLLGEDYLFANDPTHAVAEFAFVYRKNTQYAPPARKQLQLIYNADRHSSASSFEEFVENAARLHTTFAPPQASKTTLPNQGYAGSAACEPCHDGIYRQWQLAAWQRCCGRTSRRM